MTNYSEKGKTAPFPKTQASFRFFSTENCDELHRKRKGWTVPGLISFHLNRELWLITSKKKRLNRFQRPKPHLVSSQQRTVTNYIEKEKNEPFPKTQAFRFISTVESITKVRLWLITSKKERLNRSQRPKPRFVSFQQRTVTNYIEKEKTEPSPKTQASSRFISTENCD